jgi:hypothetical protein
VSIKIVSPASIALAVARKMHFTDMARLYILDIFPRIVTMVVRLHIYIIDVEQ